MFQTKRKKPLLIGCFIATSTTEVKKKWFFYLVLEASPSLPQIISPNRNDSAVGQMGGRLQEFLLHWQSICSYKLILCTVSYKVELSCKVPPSVHDHLTFYKSDSGRQYASVCQELLIQRAIALVPLGPEGRGLYYQMFFRLLPSRKFWVIINLKPLTRLVVYREEVCYFHIQDPVVTKGVYGIPGHKR